MPKVQIYSSNDLQTTHKLIELGVDIIGSCAYKASQWHSEELKKAIDLVKESHSAISSFIPLTEDPEIVASTTGFYKPDIVHLTENLWINYFEDEAKWLKRLDDIYNLQANLRKRHPELKFTRALPIPIDESAEKIPYLDVLDRFSPISDYFLIDTLAGDQNTVDDDSVQVLGEDGKGKIFIHGFCGITGLTSDWDIDKEIVEKSKVPVILAGGLSVKNVASATSCVKSFAVDSFSQTNIEHSTHVEAKKDFKLVKEFVRLAHAA